MAAVKSVARAFLPARFRRQLRAIWAAVRHGRMAGLANFFGSDKWSQRHRYTAHYERHLRGKRVRRVLEIGIGGYSNPQRGGESLRMWQRYFRRATIVGLDIYPKEVEGRRIVTYEGDQTDSELLERIALTHGPFELIVDDGSHVNEHVIASFGHLWKHVAPGGVYVIEDLETAYYPNYGGGAPGSSDTSAELLKSLVDSVNHVYIGDGRPHGRVEAEVTGVHVYQGIGFIEKLSSMTVVGDRSARDSDSSDSCGFSR